MKKIIRILLGSAILLVVMGAFGMTFGEVNDEKVPGYHDFNLTSHMFQRHHGSYGGMMGYRSSNIVDYSTADKLTAEVLETRVEEYISNFEEELEIADIFIFSDTDNYYSIIEKDTGKGAMEVLVNPYTGAVYQEHGPNMMWNLKYGMMKSRNMMGYNGRMNRHNRSNQWHDNYIERNYPLDGTIEANDLSVEAAIVKGNEFLEAENNGDKLSGSYHEFYGYYTFHIEQNGEVSGMLSVNAFTGEVWFHDWHGDLLEIHGTHEENDH